jgi:hypothetical protein
MSRVIENARFMTPWPNVENFPGREKYLQNETQKGTRLHFHFWVEICKYFSRPGNFLLRARGHKMLRFLSRVTYSILSPGWSFRPRKCCLEFTI